MGVRAQYAHAPPRGFSMCWELLHELRDVVGSDLDVVNVHALLAGGVGIAVQQAFHALHGGGSLSVGIVQNGTGHVAGSHFVQSGVQSVNAQQVDV